MALCRMNKLRRINESPGFDSPRRHHFSPLQYCISSVRKPSIHSETFCLLAIFRMFLALTSAFCRHPVALTYQGQEPAKDRISGRRLVEREADIPLARWHSRFDIADAGHAHHSGRSWNQGNSRTRAYKVKSGKDLADLLYNSRSKTCSATSPKYVIE